MATLINEMIKDADQFNKIFDELVAFTGEQEILCQLPRRCQKSVEALFTVLFHNFIQNTLNDLFSRFSEHQHIVIRVSRLIRPYVISTEFDQLQEVTEFYLDDIPSTDLIVMQEEFNPWKLFWCL